MWVIVAFIDDVVAAVPISWVINCDGNKKCYWPLQDERKKRSRNVPPLFGPDDGWELHDCVILLNGAIYDDFEDALAIEMDGIDIDDKSVNERPKLSWEGENAIERITTENMETVNWSEISTANEELFFEFQELLNRPDLCSTRNEFIREHKMPSFKNYASVQSHISEKEVLPSNQKHSDTEMLDTILKNQEEKKKILVKLVTRMYSLESAVGFNSG